MSARSRAICETSARSSASAAWTSMVRLPGRQAMSASVNSTYSASPAACSPCAIAQTLPAQPAGVRVPETIRSPRPGRHAWSEGGRDLGRAVRAFVVNEDDIEGPWVVLREQGRQRAREHGRLVPGRDDRHHPRPAPGQPDGWAFVSNQTEGAYLDPWIEFNTLGQPLKGPPPALSIGVVPGPKGLKRKCR